MSDAIADYPVYELPEWDTVTKSPHDAATEYAQFTGWTRFVSFLPGSMSR